MKASILAKALAKKGFTCQNQKRHDQYYFYCDGKKTSIRVSISRGSGYEYNSQLLSLVMKEMHLDRSQFNDFIQCPLTLERYTEILIKKELIIKKDDT